MNAVYIFGIGLDKAQGMKTSYPEFYEYLAKQKGSAMLELMKSRINTDKKLWSDMEFAFGQFTSEVKSADMMEDLYYEVKNSPRQFFRGLRVRLVWPTFYVAKVRRPGNATSIGISMLFHH